MPVPENRSVNRPVNPSFTRWALACLVTAAAVLAPGCSEGGRKRRGDSENYQTDKAQLIVRPGAVIDIDIARTEAARDRAPKDQPGLCEACGMLLAYGADVNGRFTTEGMRMDVDVVWMNHFSVIGISTDLKAPVGGQPVSTSLSPGKATEMLLLGAGGVSRLGITQGMNLQLMKN